MKNKYRVVYSFNQGGYIAQCKRWWFPIWMQIGFNYYSSSESAENLINTITYKKDI